MVNTWQKHPFPLLLYLEWALLGIALLAALGGLIPHPRHHWVSQPAWSSALGIISIAILGIMGLKLPHNSKLIQQVHLVCGFILSYSIALLISGGDRILPVLLLVVAIRACLLFSWSGRIFVAILAYLSFLTLQILSLMRIDPRGFPLGKPLPPIMRRLPPDELRRVLFGLAFNSSLLFAFVLIFVLLLVSAVVAENESRTKLSLANRRLREYALKIEDKATLEERNRIAREIHDSVGHYLTAQSIQLENTAVFLAEDPIKAAHHLAKARQLGKDALANIRASVATLRQNFLQKRSLSLKMEELISEFQSNTNIAIAAEIKLLSTLSADIETTLYRIVQEALTNIAKHSQATEVKLEIEQTTTKVLLLVRDNGCGFNQSDNTTGFGLQGMQERANALSGKIAIISQYGQGCQINLEISLSELNY
ncbi:sensor histidine kinase [Waterburya agarophytonicola K14]|uniref:Sensor histidine kinase n=1 Tax=Waterburya agarophytonicola KI4 TaxID=2874699 RepID=A0A964BSL5_9CYAN|nr:sensor histidine kinase [Waterburya agarophytonicola]MCC0178969.1 sensor histidine kinase [Waterburya agarophytonicola KI4]